MCTLQFSDNILRPLIQLELYLPQETIPFSFIIYHTQ